MTANYIYVTLIMTLICLDPYQWSLMSLITGNNVKKTHKPRYCEKEKDRQSSLIENYNFNKYINTNMIKQKQYIYCYFHDLSAKKNVRSKTIHGKTFINIWITKVKLFWKKRGAAVLTIQCNSYLSHVQCFFKIPSNFLSLISSYPLLKMLFSTLSFLWTTAVGPRQETYVNKVAM
jgi:hypothetical protein